VLGGVFRGVFERIRLNELRSQVWKGTKTSNFQYQLFAAIGSERYGGRYGYHSNN